MIIFLKALLLLLIADIIALVIIDKIKDIREEQRPERKAFRAQYRAAYQKWIVDEWNTLSSTSQDELFGDTLAKWAADKRHHFVSKVQYRCYDRDRDIIVGRAGHCDPVYMQVKRKSNNALVVI